MRASSSEEWCPVGKGVGGSGRGEFAWLLGQGLGVEGGWKVVQGDRIEVSVSILSGEMSLGARVEGAAVGDGAKVCSQRGGEDAGEEREDPFTKVCGSLLFVCGRHHVELNRFV